MGLLEFIHPGFLSDKHAIKKDPSSKSKGSIPAIADLDISEVNRLLYSEQRHRTSGT